MRWRKPQLLQLERQIAEALAEAHPQSVRHVFYLQTNPRLPVPVSKDDAGYKRVGRAVLAMRRRGDIDYRWIVDATRRAYYTPTYRTAGDLIARHASAYRENAWANNPDAPYLEVWAESRSIAGVIEDECARMAVGLFPAGGFASETFLHESAQNIRQYLEADWPEAIIFYIGDLDPAGVLIDRKIEEGIRRMLGSESLNERFSMRRLAITEAQIAEHDLPTKPRKPGERRAREVQRTVEAEAMPVQVLKGILADSVEGLLPAHEIKALAVAEREEQEGLKLLARTMDTQALSARQAAERLAG